MADKSKKTGTPLVKTVANAWSKYSYVFVFIIILIVYAIITVVRQILEPRIVGKYIGLPPLVSLAAMYVGLKLIGFWGIFLFPVGALLLYHWRRGNA